MKKLLSILIITILIGCGKDKEQKVIKNNSARPSLSNHKLDETFTSFYAICGDDRNGWCSGRFETKAAAEKSLNEHIAKTGHTDSSISNDCPFYIDTDVTSSLVLMLRSKFDKESNVLLEKEIQNQINPMLNSKIDSQFVKEQKYFSNGGGGQVDGPNRIILGGGIAGRSINVNVGGGATVRIGMWFPLASNAAGQWIVAGPGSQTIQLNCNVFHAPPGCPQWFGQPVTITAEGVNGSFPVWVSYNP